MSVSIFKGVTTEGLLIELEEESKNYTGLYVDMNNKPERKYVKDKAELINKLLKKLDRARIDKSREYKQQVEAEASAIKERLQAANLPFQSLIDEYKKERAEILAAEKTSREALEIARQLPFDHDDAIAMNELFDFKREESKRAAAIRDEEIRKQASEQARLDAIAEQVAAEKQVEFERLQRESNKAHLAEVNNAILSVLVDSGVDKETAKTVIRLAAKGLLPSLTINY